MDQRDMRLIFALVTSLAALPPGEEAHEGPAYAAVMEHYSLVEFQRIVQALGSAQIVERGHSKHSMRMTELGRKMAARLEAAAKGAAQ